jgi:enoyl-CoA hydratase/carnithine racemase
MARTLRDCAKECSTDDDVRVVILSGAGGNAFCVGGDVNAFAADQHERLRRYRARLGIGEMRRETRNLGGNKCR